MAIFEPGDLSVSASGSSQAKKTSAHGDALLRAATSVADRSRVRRGLTWINLIRGFRLVLA